jgi:mono/diheme cytochrome c family protein
MTVVGAATLRAASMAVLGVAAAGCAAPSGSVADARDIERGRALYENHCVVCHTAKVHKRVPQLPLDAEELRSIVLVWVRYEGLQWSREDVDDVVYYVNQTHYQFGK